MKATNWGKLIEMNVRTTVRQEANQYLFPSK